MTSLEINPGEVHAIMGPNGAGKSTLGYVLGGRPGYEATQGSVTFDGQDLLDMDPHERAAAGLFLGFQYPVEIPGVSNVQFLREAVNAQRAVRGQDPLSGGEFLKAAREKAALLKMDMDMMKRAVNVGFSGGEKKRNEIFQMAVLEPKLAIMDETDSGLDIDALKIVAHGVNALRAPERSILTHRMKSVEPGIAMPEIGRATIHKPLGSIPPAENYCVGQCCAATYNGTTSVNVRTSIK